MVLQKDISYFVYILSHLKQFSRLHCSMYYIFLPIPNSYYFEIPIDSHF